MPEACFIPDAEERRLALDPSQSFIVQAPAGSGKTSMLIQRYLRLLACVEMPEEIVAITFTRKAAAEMRTRILAALQSDGLMRNDESPNEKLNRELAGMVLQRDRQAGWRIAENPERLRIQTIDSLCAALTRQMPILSKFGAQPETVEDATQFYLKAARATLQLMTQDTEVACDVERLLEYLDNDFARIETLLADMLARRDHWLRHLHARTREELECSLQNSRYDAQQKVSQLLPEALQGELLQLLHYAAVNLLAEGDASIIASCADLEALSVANIEQWQGIAELLLTKDDTWRKRISRKEGFPSGNTKIEKDAAKSWKDRFEALIARLVQESGFQLALQTMRKLPPPNYSGQQWEILGIITRILPHAVAQLQIIFQESGCVDFSEVAQRAILALGDTETPTDLALALDYQIKHLLIDEFQDTSISQFELIEKLVAGWEDDDGRSLFIVGDPMQSIYRFREAEVGLFLRARNVGINNRRLRPITLSANFRSQQGIVDWVNRVFTQIMPTQEDSVTGAITFSPSVATHPMFEGNALTIHPAFARDSAAEAAKVIEIIQSNRQRYPKDTIAILVRNRNHLHEIVKQLQNNDLRFRAIDIETLHTKPVVQDLLALTRALINPADRLAWFALLRAPWCGLLLKDIAALLDIDRKDNTPQVSLTKEIVWEVIRDEGRWGEVSSDARDRIRSIRKILEPCMSHRRRQSLRMTVEAAWNALGGPGCISHKTQDDKGVAKRLDDAVIYLDYLEDQEVAGNILDMSRFQSGLSVLYAAPDLTADDTLQIMTIHKAKGLEFDTVIVPGLGYMPRNKEKQLLKWIELPRYQFLSEQNATASDLLLAPVRKTGTELDPIYCWLEKLDWDKEQLEADRLLYVAATRAKKFLHLLGHVVLSTGSNDRNELKKPRRGSLLERFWPVMESDFLMAANTYEASERNATDDDHGDTARKKLNQEISRLKSEWVLPNAPEAVRLGGINENISVHEEIDFYWVSDMARHVGSVVHRWLQQIAEEGLSMWSEKRIQELRGQFEHNLLASGMSGGEQMEVAVERIILSLTKVVTDERGRWILSPHLHAQNELKITSIVNNKLANWIIDRTFCDENRIRWIIDYKVSSHEGSDLQGFLDREKLRYQNQLNNYAKRMQQMDASLIKLGIYFPLVNGWCEWEYSG
ncbi:UvrD-helicase domain-containing protein [Nitrosomonas sp.]|uniref:UvrD-helicase domain-containing protein n=1 Tax=Nitrosomonas sp. TaxID=42353 RepID=UPI001D329ED8|nr:UvrD-helicase domain-containing protein [Nitrosomonas sp.]MBX3618191.1 UvrD-helicase domain-containing protein [Nitrosomonas sp.]